jgi:isoleucyl-tRNA synthetase
MDPSRKYGEAGILHPFYGEFIHFTQAVAVRKDLSYAIIRGKGPSQPTYIVAESLVESLVPVTGQVTVVAVVKG